MELSKKIIVTGDIALDNLTWEVDAVEICPYQQNHYKNAEDNWKLYKGYRRVTRNGGAFLLADFIQAVLSNTAPNSELFIPIIEPDNLHRTDIIQSQCILSVFKNPDNGNRSGSSAIRINRFCGFVGQDDTLPGLRKVSDEPESADIIILDDAGNSFRNRSEYWPRALSGQNGKNPLIVLKMSRPLFQGKLFFYCKENFPDSTILIINANDLRDSGIKISRQLSWEQTIHDFMWHLPINPLLEHLRSFSHFIVRFGLDGVLYCYIKNNHWAANFYYSNKGCENEYLSSFKGTMQGYNNAFIGGLAGCLVKIDNLKFDLIPDQEIDVIGQGIEAGICAARRLLYLGFIKEVDGPNYPFHQIYEKIQDGLPTISSFELTPSFWKLKDKWTILEEITQHRLDSIAFNLVEYGSDPLLEKVPIQSYGPLKVIDRNEIESYQSIKNLISEYLKRSSKNTPLSIAVFGAPGSGKSFGITKLAESIAKDKIKKIEFNLTQFNSPQDLINAFHRVRDCALTGKVPLVFFDEFDVTYNKESLGWLKYFLSPMQDGEFIDQGCHHPIGKSIFIFAGGTRESFQKFCSSGHENTSELERSSGCQFSKEFQAVKGPDFLSRLRGYINIKGINPTSPEDKLVIIRRALILRNLLETNAPGIVKKGGRVCIDKGILNAFLRVHEFRHGVRSMVAIIEMSMISKGRNFEQASLPLEDQLELHVDAKEFLTYVESDVLSTVLFGQALENIAQVVHEKYREHYLLTRPETHLSMLPWDQLDERLKESNRQHAISIPEKLRSIHYTLAPKTLSPVSTFSFSEKEVEFLAEEEYMRYFIAKQKEGHVDGITYDPAKETVPDIIPWADVDEKTKEINREFIKNIPEILNQAGFQIIAMPKEKGC